MAFPNLYNINMNAMIKKTLLALMLTGMCVACGNDKDAPSMEPKTRKDIPLSRAEEKLTDESKEFAFRFFKQVNGTEQEHPNWMVSPLSASLALGMVTNGAAGNTLAEMQKTLGFSSSSLDEMNAYYQKLTAALLDLDNTTKLGIANSIWIKQGFQVYDSFVEVNKKMYDAQVQTLDFESPNAPDVINAWCAEKTNNCIDKVIENISVDARVYLLNALYFKGMWAEKFDKSHTRAEDFTNEDGSLAKVQMMNQTGPFGYATNEFFSMAEFSYGNEAFSMVVLLPAEGKTLAESLEGLTYDNWKLWNEKLSLRPLAVKFPRFELKYKKDLIKDMEAMGMADAFYHGKADFSAMSSAELFIGLLEQHTFIKVDEEGTEAAAVTVIGSFETSVGPSYFVDFYMDRPFVFMIKEKSTGTILFMGKVTKL